MGKVYTNLSTQQMVSRAAKGEIKSGDIIWNFGAGYREVSKVLEVNKKGSITLVQKVLNKNVVAVTKFPFRAKFFGVEVLAVNGEAEYNPNSPKYDQYKKELEGIMLDDGKTGWDVYLLDKRKGIEIETRR